MSVELTKKYWQSVTVGSQVSLTDIAALEASKAEGRGLRGMEYTVNEILFIREKDNLCEWFVYKIVHPNQVLYLVAKIIDDVAELRTYYNPESIIVGNREDQINAQNTFMFANYKSNCHNNLLGLKYANQINWTFDFGKGPEEVVFNQKGNMELTGLASYDKNHFGGNSFLATISEYLAEKETPESEIMILEIGAILNSRYSTENSSKKGGSITFLVGNRINEFEISFVRNANKK